MSEFSFGEYNKEVIRLVSKRIYKEEKDFLESIANKIKEVQERLDYAADNMPDCENRSMILRSTEELASTVRAIKGYIE